MNFNSHDNLVLVAPRPVRLSSASQFPVGRHGRLVSAPRDSFEHLRISDANEKDIIEDTKVDVFIDSNGSSGRDTASPRAPSRASFSSEALEEFLSILSPSSLFSPSSPLFHPHHGATLSLPSLQSEHSPKMRALYDASNSPSPIGSEELERIVNGRKTPHKVSNDKENLVRDSTRDHNTLQPGWFGSGVLSSPVSRWHTRNPFQRHPSYEFAFSGRIETTTVLPSRASLSPAAIPLPSPTPDELDL